MNTEDLLRHESIACLLGLASGGIMLALSLSDSEMRQKIKELSALLTEKIELVMYQPLKARHNQDKHS